MERFLKNYSHLLFIAKSESFSIDRSYSLFRLEGENLIEIARDIINDRKIQVLESSDFDIYFHDGYNAYKIPAHTKELLTLASKDFNSIMMCYLDDNGRFWLGSEEGLVKFF